jgi:[acyl-carrier-protein] S-malonyltransferase
VSAFLFAGQLSEFVGMGRDFFDASGEARDLFAQTSERAGENLARALFEGTEEDLRRNRVAQPGVFLVSTLAARALHGRGVSPEAVAGYSLGNYAALVEAGAVSYADALAVLVAVLDEADRLNIAGAMGAVVGVPAASAERVCAGLRDEGQSVWIGSVNAATQVVLTGAESGVDAALSALSAQALKAFRLPMTWPIHSPLMAPVCRAIEPAVARCASIAAPRLPLYSGHGGSRIRSAGEVRELLVNQTAKPSAWKQAVEAMFADSHRRFLEVGPGETLTKMLRWIVREGECRVAGSLSAIGEIGEQA